MTGRRPWARRGLVVSAAAAALVTVPVGAASAHPLGNFSVNHYDGLRLHPDRVEDLAIVDSAEIPTLQEQPAVDGDGDGAVSATERGSYAAAACDRLAAAVLLEVDGRRLAWTVRSADLAYLPGAADLPTSRLTCRLVAAVDLTRPATVAVRDDFRADRVGWHEITAAGDGVSLVDPPVPVRSVSDELRSYPADLLSSPLGQRSAVLRAVPGDRATSPGAAVETPSAGPLSRLVSRADAVFAGLVGRRELTPLVGLLALLLSLMLGAAHAVLPGHGKTVMAAYLAGRRGRRRDALLVGATVTVTHTAGVLVLGLLLTVSSGLAGDQVLRALGIGSGLLVAAIGAVQLRSALRDRRAARSAVAGVPAGELVTVGGGHSHGGNSHGGNSHDHSHPGHSHHDDDHRHSHHDDDHRHSHHHHRDGRSGRVALVGMGIAGGLVPSPSALVVLLGAVALGRTVFGVVLVLGYGLGMAGTLTAAGLLLVHARDRLDRVAGPRRRRTAAVLTALPVATAVLVVLVGLGLAARGLAGG